MPRRKETDVPTRRIWGSRVDDPGSFPDIQEVYRNMTPAQRIEAMRQLSRFAFAIAEAAGHGPRRVPGLPDRLHGGRIEADGRRVPIPAMRAGRR